MNNWCHRAAVLSVNDDVPRHTVILVSVVRPTLLGRLSISDDVLAFV